MLDKILKFSADNSCVFLSSVMLNDDNEKAITIDDILNWLKQNNAGDYYFYTSTVELELAKHLSSEDNVLDGSSEVVIAERRDANAIVHVNDDKMVAHIRIEGPYGGQSINADDILHSLHLAMVTRGIKKQVLKRVFQTSKKLSAGEYLDVPIAYGKPQEHGKDSSIKFLVRDSRDRILRPKLRVDGTVDMRDLGNMIMVKKDQLLAIRTPATSGKEGYTVTGEILQPKGGEDIPFQLYDNSFTDPDDPNKLLALCNGLPHLHDDGVEVENSLTLETVGVSTGHVRFDGSIIIIADVLAGMRVEATGMVSIGGSVELATVIAGKDVIIHGGVFGKTAGEEQTEYNTTIISNATVRCPFAQYANITASDSIYVTQHLMHCKTRTKSNLYVCDEAKRTGTLTGGVHEAKNSIFLVNAGAVSGVTTFLSAYSALNDIIVDQIQRQSDIDKMEDDLMQIVNEELKLLQLPKTKIPIEKAEQLAWDKSNLLEELSLKKKQLDQSTKSLDDVYKKEKITVYKSCYPGTYCQLGDTSLLVKQEIVSCEFMSNGKTILVNGIN